ncbi:MAG TPA: electron transfer flavoprotein subunit alpha/FixB family protein [Candidatus Limnocylindrales bacterium]|nr:electron transfer flavoprotein subunit alpha/FixB family protein [Candidatus Limnocylindrales bacterium]
MASILVVGEVTADGGLARISTEVATLARTLAGQAGADVGGIVVAADPTAAATELAGFLPAVTAIADPSGADHVAPQRVASAALESARAADHVLVGASPDGRDVAGILSALLGRGVLVNAVGVDWDDGPVVEMSAFGGKLITRSRFTGGSGIVTVRPNVVSAEPASAPGIVTHGSTNGGANLPPVTVLDRVAEASAAAPIEEARIIVAGGRGVGSADGFRLVEELAEALGGAVGASRAAVDSGWIPYSQQIGQTGKIVKPRLYLALGISGAIQHKVGMQTAETIVAVNRDPDAPIAEFADLVVVGDLFTVGPAILAELRSRSG